MPNAKFDRPFPALTPEQRLYLEIYGYVVVPGVLTPDECASIKTALHRLRDDARKAAAPTNAHVHGARVFCSEFHTTYMALTDVDPAFAHYTSHPRLVGMVEELIGGEARVTEVDAHVNSRDPKQAVDPAPTFGFHTGTDVAFGAHFRNGLMHCNFAKTLTTLNDLGPDDGGTVVIAGSHKIDVPAEQLVACAYKDRSLIHQFIAPAGSTLLFSETLIHATGVVRSQNERAIVITGYSPTMYMEWRNGTHAHSPLDERFASSVPDELKALFFGKQVWTRGPRYRTLDQPADSRAIEPVKWTPKTRM